MPNIHVSEETVKKLHTFLNRSRESPEFGSPRKLKSFDNALNMLLDLALRYEFKDFENLCKLPLVEGEMSEEDFDDPEVMQKKILKQFEELEDAEN